MDSNGRFLTGSGANLRQASEMNCGTTEHVMQPCFLNLGYWDQSMDQSSLFGSGLTSMVSSPSTAPATAQESVVLGEVIGRLGSICNSGEISPQSHSHSPTNSCYVTPLNSPKGLNLPAISENLAIPLPPSLPALRMTYLPPFISDPSFTQRLPRFSSLGNGGGSQLGIENIPHIGLIPARSPTISDAQFGISRDESTSVSDRPIGGGTCSGDGSNSKKRKAVQKGKTNDFPISSMTMISDTSCKPRNSIQMETMNSDSKRVKCSEAMGRRSTKNELNKPKVEPSSSRGGGGDQKEEKEDKSKQDYIHVRARRGQATDSHSLAERVRREKISERMNFLQDLVPGCNKVTGKAVRLDEIINYVQSLQRQVEFLSMKLATVNPWTEFNMESHACKDIYESHRRGSVAFPSEVSTVNADPAFPFVLHTQMQSSTLRKSEGMQLPTFNGFPNFTSPSTQQQVSSDFYDNDLQNIVQMGGNIGPTNQLN